MTTNGQQDYTNKDYASLLSALLELAREKLPEWTDQSPNDPGVVLLELFAAMGDSLFYNQDRIAGESFLDTARERRSVLHLLRLIGYELRPPSTASTGLTLLFKLEATDTVRITKGTEFSTTKDKTGASIGFQYIENGVDIDTSKLSLCRLDPNGLPVVLPAGSQEKATHKIHRSLPVVQVDAPVTNEILGSSDGSPGQRFRLARGPLVDGTLDVTVDEGSKAVWTRVETLLYSKATDTHYVVRRDENDVVWVEFGDNKYAKIPRRGHNNVTVSYFAGGGAKGNVPPKAISKIVTPPAGDSLKLVLNELAASGGTDAEPIAEAALRGPQQFRSMGRAVTAADYELHAKSFGVAKVRASARGWNRIDLIVAPAGGGVPSETFKRDLRTYFDSKRIMTSQVEVENPRYVDVLIEGDLTVDPRFFKLQVQQRVEAAMRALWSFDNVDFEDTLYISKIYEAIEAVDGVAAVVITRFARSDDPVPAQPPQIPPDGTLRFAFNELANVVGIKLNHVNGGREGG